VTTNEQHWGAAIEQWLAGDGAAVGVLVRDNSEPLPIFARDFLADLATGRVNRGKGGRPENNLGRTERAIVFAVFTRWETTSKDAAIGAVADKRRTTEGAIRATVDKLRKQGITRELWQAWGRPDWSI
jgi:hypothetical protein